MTEKLLDIRNLHASYGPITALRGVDLHVNKGEIVALIGSNGAGKSTLLLSIFGSPKAKEGDIRFLSHELTLIPPHDVAPLGLALVPEGRHIFPKMTIEENLLMGLVSRRDQFEEDRELERVHQLFPKLKERRTQRAGTLSGGEQQMLAIGRALMSHPKLLLLDEPSLGLAPLIVKDIFRILKEIAARGTTIFLVEQNAGQALKLADRAYVLVQGEIKMSGTGAELLTNTQIKEAYLGEGLH